MRVKVLFIDEMDQNCLSLISWVDAEMILIPYYDAESLNLNRYHNSTKIVCGTNYFPLSTEILSTSRYFTKENETSRVNLIVSLGGTVPSIQDSKLEFELFRLVYQVPNLFVRIVESSDRVIDHPRVSVIQFYDRFYEQLAWADIALIGSGLSRYETSYAGVPAVVLLTSEEHLRMVENYQKSMSIFYGGTLYNPAEAYFYLKKLIDHAELKEEMKIRGMNLIDGKGTQRIVEQISQLLSNI